MTLAPRRRGACPALSAPMQTGDGLLVRLMPEGALSPAMLAGLAAAAAEFGNGIVEVTARGSLQLRGLAAETVARSMPPSPTSPSGHGRVWPLICRPCPGWTRRRKPAMRAALPPPCGRSWRRRALPPGSGQKSPWSSTVAAPLHWMA